MTEIAQLTDWSATLSDAYGLGEDVEIETAGIGRHILLKVDALNHVPLFFKGSILPPATPHRLEAVLGFQAHVAANAGPAARVFATSGADSNFIFYAPSGAHGVMLGRLTGRLCEATPLDARALGKALASIHDIGDQWEAASTLPRVTRSELVDQPADNIRRALQTPLQPELERLIADLGDWIGSLPQVPEFFGVCHGDSHFENAALDAEGKYCFFDFEHAHQGWRAFDLATFIWGMFRLEKGTEAWNAFIESYGHHRALTQQSVDQVRPFLLVRHLWWLGFNAGVDGPLSEKMRDRLTTGLKFLTTLSEQVGAYDVMHVREVAE